MAFNTFLSDLPFARSINRVMDEATMMDLLQIIEHESERTRFLEQAGFLDQIGVADVLFDYVLDAMGVPPDNSILPSGETFTRTSLEELFYVDYLQQREWVDIEELFHALEVAVSKLKTQMDQSISVLEEPT